VSGLSLLVVGRLSDDKLRSKVAPLVGLPGVREVAVVRRTPLAVPGLQSLCPPSWLRGLLPLSELWRAGAVLWRCARARDTTVIAFFLVPHGLYAEAARRLFGVRTVQVTISQSEVDMALRRPSVRAAYRAAQAVGVRGARSARALAALGIDEARLFDPPNVLDLASYTPATDREPDIDLLYVGNLVEEKRPDILLRAVRIVADRRPSLRVAVVGDGPWRSRLEALTRTLGLVEVVEFAGQRPGAEVSAWLRRARVFALTSGVEGLPMAMIEAICCGVPPVVPDVGDVRQVAHDGENALVVTDPTPQAYAESFERVLSDRALHARLRAGCLALRETFAREYSLPAARAVWSRALGLDEPTAGMPSC
jgi:glycosyltransferase involved in cell wall biosynthesis